MYPLDDAGDVDELERGRDRALRHMELAGWAGWVSHTGGESTMSHRAAIDESLQRIDINAESNQGFPLYFLWLSEGQLAGGRRASVVSVVSVVSVATVISGREVQKPRVGQGTEASGKVFAEGARGAGSGGGRRWGGDAPPARVTRRRAQPKKRGKTGCNGPTSASRSSRWSLSGTVPCAVADGGGSISR